MILNAAWSGRPLDELVESFGPPRMILTVPTHNAKRVLFYGVLDMTSKCIDAFAIQPNANGEEIILGYFCR